MIGFDILAILSLGIFLGFLSWQLLQFAGGAAQTRRAAEARALRVLAHMLTSTEFASFVCLGFIDVPSRLLAGRVYRIPRESGQIRVYQDGHFIGSLCIQPRGRLPDADIVLAHKVMIEGDETNYLRTANFFSSYSPRTGHDMRQNPDVLESDGAHCDSGSYTP